MPVAPIERAVQKGTGQLEGSVIEEVTYEGYGPHGVAILVECATDNRNRATGDVRHAFSKYGGSMAAAGSVSYLFKPRGVITVALDASTEDTVMEVALEAGAEDIVTGAEAYEITTPVSALEPVREALAARGIAVQHAEATKIASVLVPLGEKDAGSVLRLVGILEELDDVQQVYANFDLSDEVLAKLSH